MHRVMRAISLISAAWLLPLFGCGAEPGCGAGVAYGVQVTVTDARTGLPAAEGATGTLAAPGFNETMIPGAWQFPGQGGKLLGYVGALGRPGVYMVRIEKAGYVAWERTDVRVAQGPCTVVPALLEARLEPTAP
jgi:hypothetical protein